MGYQLAKQHKKERNMKKYTLDNTEYNKTTACIIVKDHKGEMVSIPLY